MAKRLPDKPSDLILLALHDLEAVEKDERYRVNMYAWHDPNGRCSVCLAGAVMAGTLGASPNVHRAPFMFDDDTRWKLRSLDALRAGSISEALRYWVVDRPHTLPPYDEPTDYEHDPEGFKNDMAMLAGILQAEGL